MMEYAIDKLEDLGLRKLAIMNIEQGEEIERLRNIIKEAKDFIANNSTISGTFGKNGKMIVGSIEEIHNGMRLFDILDKAGSDKE